jgi:hypothetical protein
MILAVEAWRLRQAARIALAGSRFQRAFELAGQAQQAQRTEAGEALHLVGRLLSGAGNSGC